MGEAELLIFNKVRIGVRCTQSRNSAAHFFFCCSIYQACAENLRDGSSSKHCQDLCRFLGNHSSSSCSQAKSLLRYTRSSLVNANLACHTPISPCCQEHASRQLYFVLFGEMVITINSKHPQTRDPKFAIYKGLIASFYIFATTAFPVVSCRFF